MVKDRNYSECSSIIPRLSKDASMLFPKHYICEMGIQGNNTPIRLAQTHKMALFPRRQSSSFSLNINLLENPFKLENNKPIFHSRLWSLIEMLLATNNK